MRLRVRIFQKLIKIMPFSSKKMVSEKHSSSFVIVCVEILALGDMEKCFPKAITIKKQPKSMNSIRITFKQV